MYILCIHVIIAIVYTSSLVVTVYILVYLFPCCVSRANVDEMKMIPLHVNIPIINICFNKAIKVCENVIIHTLIMIIETVLLK